MTTKQIDIQRLVEYLKKQSENGKTKIEDESTVRVGGALIRYYDSIDPKYSNPHYSVTTKSREYIILQDRIYTYEDILRIEEISFGGHVNLEYDTSKHLDIYNTIRYIYRKTRNKNFKKFLIKKNLPFLLAFSALVAMIAQYWVNCASTKKQEKQNETPVKKEQIIDTTAAPTQAKDTIMYNEALKKYQR